MSDENVNERQEDEKEKAEAPEPDFFTQFMFGRQLPVHSEKLPKKRAKRAIRLSKNF